MQRAVNAALSRANLLASLSGLECNVTPDPPTLYESTQTAEVTLSCPDGSVGDDVTETGTGISTSYISQEDADNKAHVLALLDANEKAAKSLSCSGVTRYDSTQTAISSCPEGTIGDNVSATRSAYSYISQEDADEQAFAAAQSAADAARVCVPITYTATESCTVDCPAGTTGQSQTASGSATSSTSYEDAQQKAYDQACEIATSRLSCGPYFAETTVDITCPDGHIETGHGTGTGESYEAALAVAQENARIDGENKCSSS